MASSATVTSKTGPGNTVSSLVISNMQNFSVELGPGKNRLTIQNDVRIFEFDINATTTFTGTITAGGNLALTVAQ